jgi:hypothetical protein
VAGRQAGGQVKWRTSCPCSAGTSSRSPD